MAEQAIDYSILGRRIAMLRGYDPGEIDLAAYGRACSEAAGGKARGDCPSPEAFVLHRVTSGAAPAAVQSCQAPAPSQPTGHVYLAPKSVHEVRELVAEGIINKAQARAYLGLREHWWSR